MLISVQKTEENIWPCSSICKQSKLLSVKDTVLDITILAFTVAKTLS